MALVLADRVRDTTTTTGTGTVTLSGTAPTGYQTFATAIGNANTTYYTINAGFQWEVGIGTFTTSGNTLTRTTVLSSSSAGALVDFAVGTKDVFVTYPAEKAVNYDGSDNVGIGTTAPTTKLTVVGTGSATTLATGLGAVGTPAHTFTGDLSTGMWSPATGNIAVSTGGVERMRIGSSGNVGIGTATPGSFGLLAAVKDATGVTTVAVSNGNAATNDGAKFSSFYVTTEMSSLGHYWDGSQFIGKQFSYGDLTFLLGSTPVERMRLDASGNLGLNAVPVAGYGNSIQLKQVGASATSALLHQSVGTNIQNLELLNNALPPAGGYTAGYNYTTTGNAATKYLSQAGNHIWYNAPTGTAGAAVVFSERMRIDSTGNVGIGTSAPTAKLNVAGDTIISGNADARQIGFNFYGTSQYNFYVDGATDAAKMTIRSGTTSVATFDSSGNLGIGTSAPAYQLQLSTDSAAKPSTNTWTIASDSRIKTETGEYTKGLDAVCALRPITYHYNGVAGFVDDGKENISIIAQEAMQHFPECVGTFEALLNEGDEEKTELFNWNGHALTFALVNAVKELKAVNDALTARVAQLEGK